MTIETIVVGIDGSQASLQAARMAWDLATTAEATCHIVHIASDVPYLPAWPIDTPPEDIAGILTAHARERMTAALEGELPAEAVRRLEIEMGSAAWTLPRIADHYDADLVVLGGKHHAGLVRLFGGSVAHHLVRVMDRPILVTDAQHVPIRHVTVAIDLAAGSERVLSATSQLAALTGATLRIVHAIEPLPPTTGSDVVFDHAAYESWCRAAFEEIVTKHTPTAERLIVVGHPRDVLESALEQSPTDVLAVGSHGKGFVDRALLGSVAHRLLTTLPTSLLVVPVAAAVQPGRE